MYKIIQVLMIVLLLGIGSQSFAQEDPEIKHGGEKSVVSIGENIQLENILTSYQMEGKYRNLKPGDTLATSFTAEVTSVCKNKGCWMKVGLEDGSEVVVKFKNYAFFVPRDIENSAVFIKGVAYIEEMSVEEQQHYAQDEGKSGVEISAITKPKKALLFLADGVKIQK